MHCHTTEQSSGLRQCSDPRCGAWTIDGRNWALNPETLAVEHGAYPTGAEEDALRLAMPAMTITLAPASVAA